MFRLGGGPTTAAAAAAIPGVDSGAGSEAGGADILRAGWMTSGAVTVGICDCECECGCGFRKMDGRRNCSCDCDCDWGVMVRVELAELRWLTSPGPDDTARRMLVGRSGALSVALTRVVGADVLPSPSRCRPRVIDARLPPGCDMACNGVVAVSRSAKGAGRAAATVAAEAPASGSLERRLGVLAIALGSLRDADLCPLDGLTSLTSVARSDRSGAGAHVMPGALPFRCCCCC